MAITDAQKVDFLYKKIGAGVAKTDTSAFKSPSNEANASPLLTRGDTIWQQSVSIPVVKPASNSSVLVLYQDTLSSTIECVLDTSVSGTNRTWFTNQVDWIGSEFGATYQVQVYAALAGNSAPQTYGTQLFSDGSGNSDTWFFDYQSGILNFPDTNVPTAVTGKKIYISGARYVGAKGITNFPTGITLGNISISGNTISSSNGNVTINSNLNIIGNTTFYGYSDLTITDSILNLHTQANLAPWTTNDGKDIGLKMHYYDGVDSHAALIRANNSGYLEWYARGTEISGNTFAGSAYGTIKTGALILANTTPATGANTGALQVWGGSSIGGNLYVTANIVAPTVVSNTLVATSFTLIGNSYTSGDTYANTATIGNIRIANSSIVSANVINFYSGSSAIKVPVGNNDDRPVIAASGYLRYNTESSTLEYFDGIGWISVTNTIESQDIFTGDGTTTTFTLDRSSPSSGLLVNINGTLQQPEIAYTVIGDQITFAEAPQATDFIDIRFLGAAVTVNFDSTIISAPNVSVNTVSRVVDRFDASLYRSARYTISSTNPVDSTFTEVMLLQQNGNVFMNMFGTLNTGSNTVTFTANVDSGNVNLIANGTTSSNQLRIQKTYFAV